MSEGIDSSVYTDCTAGDRSLSNSFVQSGEFDNDQEDGQVDVVEEEGEEEGEKEGERKRREE